MARPRTARQAGSAIFVIPFVAAVVYARWPDISRNRLRSVAGLCLIPLAYQLFRMVYFASILPNPAYAKEAFLLLPDRGLTYAWNFVHSYTLWVPGAGLAGLMATSWYRYPAARLPMASLIGGGLLHALYIVGIGRLHARPASAAIHICGDDGRRGVTGHTPPRSRPGDDVSARHRSMGGDLQLAASSARYRRSSCADRRRAAVLRRPVRSPASRRAGGLFALRMAVTAQERYGPIDGSISIPTSAWRASAPERSRVIDTVGWPIRVPRGSDWRTGRARPRKGVAPPVVLGARRPVQHDTGGRGRPRCPELRRASRAHERNHGDWCTGSVWRNLSIALRTRNLRIPADPKLARWRFCK